MYPMRTCVCVAGLVCALASPASAQDASQSAQPESEIAASQKAAVDPATGRLRQPTLDETRALEAVTRLLSRPVESLQVKVHANGMLSVDLGETFLDVALARITPDGHLEGACVHSLDDARTFLLSPPRPRPAAPVLEEK